MTPDPVPIPLVPGPINRSVLIAVVTVLLAPPAFAQRGSTHPGPGYHAAVEELHEGDFVRAERGMRNELRGSLKTIDGRWVDAIIYATGLGEALYQQGRLREALAQFDAAIDQFLAEPDWLRKLKANQALRPDANVAARLPAWARLDRPIVYANVPRSFLYSWGQVNNSQAYQQGGVVRQAQFWKLDAEEVARSIAWNLYRRGQLLGPLGAHDRRTSAVLNRIAGGGIGVSGHWTGAWVELWWGLAAAGTGDVVGGEVHLRKSLVLAGRYDHRLSGIAWLAIGRLATGTGNGDAALQAFREATSAALAYEDLDVLVDATLAWHAASQALGAKQPPFPPLEGITAWSDRRRLSLASAAARLAAAELNPGVEVATPFRRGRDLTNGLIGRELTRLRAAAAAETAPLRDATRQARQAVVGQAAMSRRRMQVALATEWSRTGLLSPRIARQVFPEVLSDPNAITWTTNPLEGLAWMAAPETAAFDRWFATALERRDATEAMRVIDAQRRRELFAGQPLAGRMIALRWLLEAPTDTLPKYALEPRARVEGLAPGYRELRRDGDLAADALRTALAGSTESISPSVKNAAEAFGDSVAARERVVLRLALSRAPTPLVFPPPIDTLTAKSSLKMGEAVLAFHDTGGELFGVVLTADGEHLWRIGKTDRVAQQIEQLLRGVAGKSARQSWTLEDLDEDAWTEPADKLATTLLSESRLDAATLERLWVIPDGPLWRAPLGVLAIPGQETPARRLGEVTLTYAPTPGWAVRTRPAAGASESERPTWRVTAEGRDPREWEGVDPFEATARVASPPRGFERSIPLLKPAASRLIFDAGAKPLGSDPLGLGITTADDGQRELAAWLRLPYDGPKEVALLNLGGGEAGGAKRRRSKATPLVGAPELHAVGALLAGGAQSALIERWPTRGARSRDLVAEWLNGLGRLSTEAAWRRSLALGRETQLDPTREPRLSLDPTENATGEHPFWWSGYLLID